MLSCGKSVKEHTACCRISKMMTSISTYNLTKNDDFHSTYSFHR
jgi:hypothetical protein